jgi:hypothetical protein
LSNASCIEVPSPQEIRDGLFPQGIVKPPSLPPTWTARVLLVPFGGLSVSPTVPSDQLVVGKLTYEAFSPTERLMRVRLYLFESLKYYDFLFRTSDGQTQWWWSISDPSKPHALPICAFGPFATAATVPAQDFLASNHFTHVGTWNVLGVLREAFSARRKEEAGTWFWFNSGTHKLARIMNVDGGNNFQIPVLGAYYLVDLRYFRRISSSQLADVYRICSTAKGIMRPPSPMLTLSDILSAMAASPCGSQTPCTMRQIQKIIPGISPPTGTVTPPSWTHHVNSQCYMIGPHTSPYYSQVWYDWDRGVQVTLIVHQDDAGEYTGRFEWVLLKGKPGPRVDYSWKDSKWTPQCCDAGGGMVPMPVPNFVEAGDGRCGAVINNDPCFETLSIWSVASSGERGVWESNFWYWFTDQQKQVIFSMGPPHFLTLIDYQTFVQNGAIEACIFDNPCGQLPACPRPKMVMARAIHTA